MMEVLCMETIFISGGFLIALLPSSQSLSKGVGTVGGALKQIGCSSCKRTHPAWSTSLTTRTAGSRTWMNFGMLWLVFAALLGFLSGWHNYDPAALDSLASVGWSYDDGSALTDATLNFLTIALLYGMIGSGLVATARNSNGRMASEANASMVAVLLSAVLVASYLLPFIFGFLDIDTETAAWPPCSTALRRWLSVCSSCPCSSTSSSRPPTVVNKNFRPAFGSLSWASPLTSSPCSTCSLVNSPTPPRRCGWLSVWPTAGFHLP